MVAVASAAAGMNAPGKELVVTDDDAAADGIVETAVAGVPCLFLFCLLFLARGGTFE